MAEERPQCCLKSCQHANKTVTSESDRASVKAYPLKGNSKEGMFVNWMPDGKAVFHLDCWQHLAVAAKRSPPTDLVLGGREADMVKEASKTAEYHFSDSHVAEEAARIAHILKTSKYCIAFTGAGISTAAGIGDFRGIEGKWTSQDKEKKFGKGAGTSGASAGKKGKRRGMYMPTYTHEALVKLIEMGVIKFLISQNTDGLHRLSGVPQEKLAELHGNSYQEKCEQCGHRYDGRHQNKAAVPPKVCKHCRINHRTGGICSQPGCGGYLMNTIINFGDSLESEVLGKAYEEAGKNDAVLVLGSTLRVTPASDLVVEGPPPVRLIICNRQVTPYDDIAVEKGRDGKMLGARVFGDCDVLMRLVMKQLLPAEDLAQWEGERDVRLAQYMIARQAVL